MKCPCCGKEMVMDGHRKIDMFMCYECGYIEGRRLNDTYVPKTAARHTFGIKKIAAVLAAAWL